MSTNLSQLARPCNRVKNNQQSTSIPTDPDVRKSASDKAHNTIGDHEDVVLSALDHEYLLQYIKSFNIVFSQDEDSVFIKDMNFRYQNATKKMLSMLGYDDLNHIKDKNLSEIIDKESPCAHMLDQWLKQDMLVTIKKTRKVYLEIVSHDGGKKIFLHYKYPIINPATNNCIGIRGEITSLVWPHAVKTLFKIHGTKGLLLSQKTIKGDMLEKYPLSSAQHMVLFLCINNYSYSEISLLLNEFGHSISPIRVNDYLEQLKLIFHVRNKNQLIEKSVGLGFHAILPDGLFNKFSSTEISYEEAQIRACA